MAKITYEDKEFLNKNKNIADKNKVNDTDLNEIKTVVNQNDTNVGDLAALNTNDKSSIVNAINSLTNCGKFIKLNKTSSQSYSANTRFEVSWQTETFNNTNNILTKNNNHVQCTSGTHTVLINAFLQMIGSSENYIYISYNGQQIASFINSGGGASTIMSVVLQMNENDYVSVDAYGNNNGNVGGTEDWTNFIVPILN